MQGGILQRAMLLMDELSFDKGGTVAFIFSALVQESVLRWTGNTGRALYDVALPLLGDCFDRTMEVLQKKFRGSDCAQALLRNPKNNCRTKAMFWASSVCGPAGLHCVQL